MVMDNESTEEPITDLPKLKPSHLAHGWVLYILWASDILVLKISKLMWYLI